MQRFQQKEKLTRTMWIVLVITSPDKNFPQKINLIVNWDTSDNRYTFNTQIQGIPLNMGILTSMSALFHAALLREHILSIIFVLNN